jgi:hypothetical protein
MSDELRSWKFGAQMSKQGVSLSQTYKAFGDTRDSDIRKSIKEGWDDMKKFLILKELGNE